MMWWQYLSDNGGAAGHVSAENSDIRASLRRMSRTVVPAIASQAQEGRDAVDEDEDNEEKEPSNPMVTLANTLVMAGMLLAYPVAVLPYYRAETTSEYVCVICGRALEKCAATDRN